jgi:hypothetical protein
MRRLLMLALFCPAISFAQTDSSERFSQILRGSGQHALPSGFTVSAHNGTTGQAITGSLSGQKSAKAAFSVAFRQIAPYFDKTPLLLSAAGDQKDQQVQAFFRSAYSGAPVRGLMVVTAQNGSANVALLFDRDDQFTKSLPVLSKQMSTALPKPAQGGSQAPPQLQKTRLPDGSGWISLAPGWKVTSASKGSVDAAGPDAEIMSLGIATKVLPSMHGPYRPPWPAFQLYVDTANKGALNRGEISLRLIDQVPDQYQGGQAAWINYEVIRQGKARRGLAWVATAKLPSDIGAWFFYCSMAAAPAEVFGRDLPALVAMWKSWGVSQAVFRERMDSALRSMHEINRLIQETNDYRSKTFDNANYGWTETMRGVTMVENIATHGRAEIDTNNAQWFVDEMNRQCYNFRIVPITELVHDLSGR